MDAWLRARAKEIHAAAETMEVKGFAKIAHQQAAYLNAAARDGFDFVGEQDIVEHHVDDFLREDVLVIRDVKTSKKSPSEDAAEKSNQLTAYAIASQVLDGKLPDAMKLDYLVDLKKSTKTMTLTTTRDDQQAKSYLNRIVNGIAAIRSGIFVPASDLSWWCSEKMCGYWNICPHVKHSTTSLPQFVQIKEADLNKEDR
jgi:hypothetical protein